MKVVYVVGKDVSTSIALEVGSGINDKEVNFSVLAFKEKDKKKSENFDVRIVPIGANSFWDPEGVYVLWKYIRKENPDVVHVHRTTSGFWCAIISQLISEAKVVRTEHGNQKSYTFFQNIIHTITQIMSDYVVCNSYDTYENTYPIQKKFVGDEWGVVYNGVDIDRISSASHREPPSPIKKLESQFLVGSVGRLIDPKNYQRLIQAFSLVLEDFPEAHLVLVGDGQNRSRLEREVRTLGLEGRVTFTGLLSRDDVFATLYHFDVYVMPSLWEGFCNAVVEAMAAGLPVVSSDISTLREVVGEVAVYVDPEDPEDIARGIVNLLNEASEVLSERGQACQERAVEQYSLEKTVEGYLSVYEKLTN